MLSLLFFVWMFRDATPIPCDSWLAVESVTPGRADFHVLPHDLQEHESPYIVGYNCLHQPNHVCPGDESMAWPNGVLGDQMTFYSPQGGPYQLVVAKYIMVNGKWVPTRACSTVEIEPAMSYER